MLHSYNSGLEWGILPAEREYWPGSGNLKSNISAFVSRGGGAGGRGSGGGI